MLVPNPNRAFQSPGTHSLGLKRDDEEEALVMGILRRVCG
jgi:hypothetical protein